MSQPLMPKAVAVWLVDNTSLTFDQIAAFHKNAKPPVIRHCQSGKNVLLRLLGWCETTLN